MNFCGLQKRIIRIISVFAAISLCFCCVSTSAYAESDGTIVEITDIDAPDVGFLPDYNGTIIGDYYEFFGEDYGYVINGITWYNLTDDTNIDENTPFEADKVYKLTILVMPKEGNPWTLESAFVNGISAEVAVSDDFYIISYTFGEYVYVDTDGAVAVTGVSEPADGETPDYSVSVESDFFELYEETEGYIYEGVTWFDTTSQSNMDVTDTFLYDHIYEVTILLKKCEGCEVPLTSVTINGKEASFYEADGYYVASLSFVECADTVIRTVALALLREPVAGAVPCYNVYPDNDKYTLNESKNDIYYQYGVCWYDVTEGANLIIGEDKFIEGHVYQLEVYLSPKENYTFNLSAAKINAFDAEIWGSNKSVILMYEFEPCEKAENVIYGSVASTQNDEDNDVTIELYEATRDELFLETTLYNSPYYYISEIPPGEYILTVNKSEHVERKYYISIENNSTINLDIYIAKKGDCDMDGEIDVIDYQRVVNITVRNINEVPYYTTDEEEYELSLCDYAEDGYVDALDCASIALLAADSKNYDCIEVTGIIKPVAGVLPTYSASIVSTEYELYAEDYGNIYNGIAWYDVTEDANLDKTDAFVAGHTYSVTIEIVPSDGGEWDLKYATYDGELVKARKSSDCYLVSFTFKI